ncbi:MAG: hypothetical protein IPI30_23470 [Saprospiraceae bacterium]|nr:hypothetical protein [Candidatus Vicinibacter affinis]
MNLRWLHFWQIDTSIPHNDHIGEISGKRISCTQIWRAADGSFHATRSLKSGHATRTIPEILRNASLSDSSHWTHLNWWTVNYKPMVAEKVVSITINKEHYCC